MSRYRHLLTRVSERTGVPLPSLILSFGIVHEFTALIPLVGFFWAGRTLGVGETVLDRLKQSDETQDIWWQKKTKEYIEQGEAWAGRVGTRYGFFGYQKGVQSQPTPGALGVSIGGDVANAVLAYTLTKALLPARIGLSLYLSPSFSRRVVEPARRGLMQLFRRKQ